MAWPRQHEQSRTTSLGCPVCYDHPRPSEHLYHCQQCSQCQWKHSANQSLNESQVWQLAKKQPTNALSNLRKAWNASMKPSAKEQSKHSHLITYNKELWWFESIWHNPMHGKQTYLDIQIFSQSLTTSLLLPPHLSTNGRKTSRLGSNCMVPNLVNRAKTTPSPKKCHLKLSWPLSSPQEMCRIVNLQPFVKPKS